MSGISLKSQLRILKKDLASRTEQELSALVEAFQDTTFFKQLDDEAMRQVCKAIVAERYHVGDTIFEEGDSGDKFYIVLSGRVEVIVRLDQEEQQVLTRRSTTVDSTIKLFVAKAQSAEVSGVQALQQRFATNIRKKLIHRTKENAADNPVDAAEQWRRHERRLATLMGLTEAQLRTADWMDMFKEADQNKPLLSPRDKAEASYDLQPRDISLTSDAGIAILAMEKQATGTNATRKAVASSPPEQSGPAELQGEEEPSQQPSRSVSFKGLVEVKGGDSEKASDSEGGDDPASGNLSDQAEGEEGSDKDSDADSTTGPASNSDSRGATPPPKPQMTKSLSSISSPPSSPSSPRSPRARPTMHRAKNTPKILTSKVASLPAGASFGETALEGDVPRSATVKCEEACWLAVLHRNDYKRIMTYIMEEKRAEHLRYTERCPLLAGLPLHERVHLAAMFREISATQNTVVCSLRQAAAEVYFVVEGEFAVNASRGASGASHHAQGSGNSRDASSQVVTTTLLSAPQVHGLGSCLRGEQYHQEALVCRSSKGKVYSLLAKHLLHALPKEQREVLMFGTLAQRQFRQNRAAVLRQIEERPKKHPESPTKKAPRGVYFPDGRLQAIRQGLEKKKYNEEEKALVGDCWNPANYQATIPNEEKEDASEKVPLIESNHAGSRHLNPQLLGFWSQGQLHEMARLHRAGSEGLLHRMPPPLEVNPFRVSIGQPQEPEPYSLAMASSASEPLLLSEEMKVEPEETSSNSRQGSSRLAPSPCSRLPSFSPRLPSQAKYRDDSLARKLDLELAEMDSAASRIQASLRGLVQRSAMKKLRCAALKMQAVTRGFLVRSRKLQENRESEVAADTLAAQEQAVTRIQSVVRGLLARRRYAILAKEKLEEMPQEQSRMSSLASRQLWSAKSMVSLEVDATEPSAKLKTSPFLQRSSRSRLVTLDVDGPSLHVLKKVLGWRERHRKLPLPPPEPAENYTASPRAARSFFVQSASKTYYSFPMQEREMVESNVEAETFSQRRGAALPQLNGAARRTLHGKPSSHHMPRPPEKSRTFEGFRRRRSYQEEAEATLDHDDDDEQSAAEEEEAGISQPLAFMDEDELKLPLLGNGKATLFASGMGEAGALSPWRGATGTLSSHAAAHASPVKQSDACAMRLPDFNSPKSRHPETNVDLSTIYTWSRR